MNRSAKHHRKLRHGPALRGVALVLAAGLVVAGCTEADPEAGATTAAELGGEAPTLAALVESGDLPPVEERLPLEPVVVTAHESLGQYGGTWRTVTQGPGDEVWFQRTIGYEPIVRWIPEWTGAPGDAEVIPNIAESYDVNADGTVYTFHLREGMRWSDGEPVTTADVQLYYDLVGDPEIVGSVDGISDAPLKSASGELAALEIGDDYTFTLTFAEPSGVFVPSLAEGTSFMVPRHYLEQFLPDYNADLDALVEAEGFTTWAELLAAKYDPWTNPELPVLNPWVVTEPLGAGTAVVAERNPYYWKVDTEGNQLPYIDTVRYTVMNEPEVMLAAAIQGDIDMHVRHFNTAVNKPVLAQAREEANFDFFNLIPGLANELVVMLNLTHQDPVMREIFNNLDFRIGLSHAINREEIVNTVYQRQGTPSQVSPQPESPFYSEELSTQYTEYDLDLANEALDRAGYSERDAQGRRLGPDGQPISFTVDNPGQPGFDDSLALISGYWAEVGITMTPNSMDRSLYEERRGANIPDAGVWLAGGGTDVVQNPFWYLPVSNRSDYAQLWATWYTTGGADGEAPPEATQRQMELYDEVRATFDPDRQAELMTQILEISAEQFYHIGTVLPASGYGIVSNDFHNVPELIPDSYRVNTPALANPEQFYITQ
jgi:peptide/nickel transport system substrate-binding protein